MSIVYLNGEFTPAENAKVSVFDRGFLFSDGVYEVIPAYRGKLLGLDEHLARLEKSLTQIHLTPPFSTDEWKTLLKTLLAKNQALDSDQVIYIQVTRGVSPTRNHAIPSDIQPTCFAYCTPHEFLSLEKASKGFSAITREDRRRSDCYIKSVGLLPNVLAYQEAVNTGAAETILIRHGEAIEGTSSNLFIVKDNTVITPPLSPHILAGITRGFILHLLAEHGITHREARITEDELHQADEIWVTGSKKEIYPIVTLDEKPVGFGKAGPVWQTIAKLYQQQKEVAPSLGG